MSNSPYDDFFREGAKASPITERMRGYTVSNDRRRAHQLYTPPQPLMRDPTTAIRWQRLMDLAINVPNEIGDLLVSPDPDLTVGTKKFKIAACSALLENKAIIEAYRRGCEKRRNKKEDKK